MVQDAVGTNPVAEDAPEQQRRDDQQQAPQQTHVNRVRGDGRGEGNQRVKFEEQRNRIAFEIPQVGDKDEKQKQAEEKNLGDTAGGAGFHGTKTVKRRGAGNAKFRRDGGQDFGLRWQSAAATPLFDCGQSVQRGVVLRFPPLSKKIWLPLRSAASLRCKFEFTPELLCKACPSSFCCQGHDRGPCGCRSARRYHAPSGAYNRSCPRPPCPCPRRPCPSASRRRGVHRWGRFSSARSCRRAQRASASSSARNRKRCCEYIDGTGCVVRRAGHTSFSSSSRRGRGCDPCTARHR